jgi:Sec-independent protein translocase protein TatA
MFRFSSMVLVIVMAIFLLLFGVGRPTRLGRELGGGICAVRKGLQEDEELGEEIKTDIP